MPALDKHELIRLINALETQASNLRLQLDACISELPKDEATIGSNTGLPLDLDEYIRYGRQMIIPQIGLPGQLALRNASVLVIGAGGLGCAVLLYLVAAGIGKSNYSKSLMLTGKVGIADPDRVDLSNLHRQVLHRSGYIGELKTISAERTLKQLVLN